MSLETVFPFIRRHWLRFLVAAVLLIVFFGNQGFIGLVRNYKQLRRLRQEIAALEREEASLSERLKVMRSGDASLERLARKELGYIKKGEIEYRFTPPSPEKK